MCGRIVRLDIDAIDWDYFGISGESETRIHPDLRRYGARYNIAPTQEDLIVRPAASGDREVVPSRWGLIPRWAKDRSIASKMFNARSESLLERASFKNLVAKHRSVTPVSGYYEWRKMGKQKIPVYIYRKDGEPIALAGLWTTWADPERSGAEVTSHTIITCAPNEAMAVIHNRMPVVLTDDALDRWLDPEERDPGVLLSLLRPPPDDLLETREVSTAVNKVGNDGPELIEPAA